MAAIGPQKPPIRFRALEKVKPELIPAPLQDLCLRRLAKNLKELDNEARAKLWEAIPQRLEQQQIEKVFTLLSLEIPIAEAAIRINDEPYWKRRTVAHFGRNVQIKDHGMSWKQGFIERVLAEKLEKLQINYTDEEKAAVKEIVWAGRKYIFQLRLSQLPSHVDLNQFFDALPALTRLTITYGNRRLGMNYERALFGMKISDAHYLARTVRVCQTLTSLSLPCNMVDDELVRMLMAGLKHGHMLTSLDLSHNRIGDRGARRLAELLDRRFCLHQLDLSDNQIHANGAMHIGAHLADNQTLAVMNLRLNRCEDNGVSHLFQDMCVNKHLRVLNVSCNDLTIRCVPYLNEMVTQNSSLQNLDLSGNPIYNPADTDEMVDRPPTPDGDGAPAALEEDSPIAQFVQAIESNRGLRQLDLRSCALPTDLETSLTRTVKHRDLAAKGIPVEAYERVPQQTVEEIPQPTEGEAEEQAEAAPADSAAEEKSAEKEDGAPAAEANGSAEEAPPAQPPAEGEAPAPAAEG